ncbi:MAG: MBL fold metallo-hydrolase [Candidatus Heimdallarchaeota archaeon]|nr:MBL fold metallo-hydrolase [Candidatus Heimdallarchaeota archaeon]MCK4769617.1 MBL fold metallo-hydrolase [Candidatus Heimdallarchaeota archaeon]
MFELEQVSENVWAHTKGETRGNVAFIKMKQSGIMVDTGMDPITAKIARDTAEKEMGVPIKYLVITHHHGDHVFGNQVLEDCEIISSKDMKEIMEEQVSKNWTKEKLEERMDQVPEFREKWADLRFVLPTVTFEGEYTIEEEGVKVEIVQTNGHTRGSSYLFIPSDNIVITGDLLFAETFPYGGDPTADPYLWIDAYTQMIYLNPAKVVPGHGPITFKEELEIQQKYLEMLVKKIEDLVVDGLTKEEVLERTDFPEFPYEVDANRVKAMLERCFDVIKEAVDSY